MPLDTSSIDPLFEQAGKASDKAIGLAASGANLPQMLREAVTGRLEASPLFGQREKAAEQVLTSGSRARESVADTVRGGAILSPTQQQSVISARGAADVVPLTSLNDLLTTRIGGVDTAVNTGLNAFQTLLQNAQQQATLKQGQAESAFDRLLGTAASDRAERELGLKEAAAKGSDLKTLLQNLINRGGGTTADVGQGPQFTPTTGEGTIAKDDETGIEWQFQNGRWVPEDTPAADQSDLINQVLTMGTISGEFPASLTTTLQSQGLIEKPKSALERRKDTELASTTSQVVNIVNTALTAPSGPAGGFLSQAGRLWGVPGGGAETLRRKTRGLAKSIANVFSAGEARVTDEDIDRWLGLMPKPGDTEQERIDNSKDMINSFISTANVRGMEIPPEILNLRTKLSKL